MAERVRTDPRISRRRRAIERGRRRRNIAIGVTVATIITLAWAALGSPLLNVKSIKVAGVRNATVADVQAAAAVGSDANLLMLSTSEVAERVQSIPWIRSARVVRRLPNTLAIEVRERRAAVALDLGEGERWLLDPTGLALAPLVGETELPVLAGVSAPALEAGESLDHPGARAALTVIRALPRAIGETVVGVFAPTPSRITLSLDGGTVVRYGSAYRTRAKNAVLKILLRDIALEGRTTSYIDVRVPENPAVGPAAQPAPAPTPIETTGTADPEPSPSPTA